LLKLINIIFLNYVYKVIGIKLFLLKYKQINMIKEYVYH